MHINNVINKQTSDWPIEFHENVTTVHISLSEVSSHTDRRTQQLNTIQSHQCNISTTLTYHSGHNSFHLAQNNCNQPSNLVNRDVSTPLFMVCCCPHPHTAVLARPICVRLQTVDCHAGLCFYSLSISYFEKVSDSIVFALGIHTSLATKYGQQLDNEILYSTGPQYGTVCHLLYVKIVSHRTCSGSNGKHFLGQWYTSSGATVAFLCWWHHLRMSSLTYLLTYATFWMQGTYSVGLVKSGSVLWEKVTKVDKHVEMVRCNTRCITLSCNNAATQWYESYINTATFVL